MGTVASLHGSPKPLQASSSLCLGQNSKKRHRPYSSLSDEDSDESDLEYDGDELEVEVGSVARNRDFYAQLEEEEKANAQVNSYKFGINVTVYFKPGKYMRMMCYSFSDTGILGKKEVRVLPKGFEPMALPIASSDTIPLSYRRLGFRFIKPMQVLLSIQIT